MGRFGSEFHFNGFTFGILSLLFPTEWSVLISAAIFLGAYITVIFLTPDPIRACGNVAIAFLLTSPTAHPWYFTIIAMFAVLYPVRSWIVLSGTVGLSWLVSFHFIMTGIWKESPLFFLFEYMPPFLMGFLTRWRWPEFVSPGFGIPASVSIIIPALNEGHQLRVCLKSIRIPNCIRSEILVVDGGSSDDTSMVAQSDPRVNLVISVRGRGHQIAQGVDQAIGDLIIVVHADTVLVEDGVERIYRFCKNHPHICGGSVASKFSKPGPRFVFITALNNFRSRFSGISFGDQVQFFRREVLHNVMPRVKLMEDIEISMLLKERGAIAILPSLATFSTRRWQQKSYAQNMLMVIALTTAYLVRRRCGMLRGDNSDFYKAYYGKV